MCRKGGGRAVPLDNLGALGALFAFGGSLLGAPGFFFNNTSLSPVGLLALLLPFLVVLASGLSAMRRDRDTLLLLGLPPLITIACPLLLSAVKSLFIPRWFSFLFPLYAAFLARGVVDLGERLGRHRREAAALITAGLLAYSAPVLGHYYFDPLFGDQWRAASRIVSERFRTGDIVLYGAPQNELTFTYYFGDRHPGMILSAGTQYFSGALPVPRLGGPPVGTPVPFGVLAKRYRRIWVVAAPPFTSGMLHRTFADLRGSAVLVGEIRWGRRDWGVVPVFPSVYLFRSRVAPSR